MIATMSIPCFVSELLDDVGILPCHHHHHHAITSSPECRIPHFRPSSQCVLCVPSGFPYISPSPTHGRGSDRRDHSLLKCPKGVILVRHISSECSESPARHLA